VVIIRPTTKRTGGYARTATRTPPETSTQVGLAAFLLCALLAAAALAAPAPGPRTTGPWFDGWDEPIDPLGDCRFQRKGDQLAIVVPGTGLSLDASKWPRLLRDVEGDFAVQVRVGGEFRQAELAGRDVARRAGLLLTDGKDFVRLLRAAYRGAPTGVGFHSLDAWHLTVEFNLHRSWSNWQYAEGPPLRAPAYLRLERRGERLTFLVSRDGKGWELAAVPSLLKFPHTVKMPPKVKVGVVAEATAEGRFEARFDQFRVGRPPDRGVEELFDLYVGVPSKNSP
jgi:regulation of enolase protein 1 (concanavalin A-like superfamily)